MSSVTFLVQAALVVTVIAASVITAPRETYTKKFDQVDVDAFLRNDRLFKRSFECLMDRGSCTPEILELKKNLPDALQSGCSKCSEKQKVEAEKILKFLVENKKSYYDELKKKYDPEGKFENKYKEVADEKGIKV